MEVDVDPLKLVRAVLRQAEEQTGLIHSASIGGARSKKGGPHEVHCSMDS